MLSNIHINLPGDSLPPPFLMKCWLFVCPPAENRLESGVAFPAVKSNGYPISESLIRTILRVADPLENYFPLLTSYTQSSSHLSQFVI